MWLVKLQHTLSPEVQRQAKMWGGYLADLLMQLLLLHPDS